MKNPPEKLIVLRHRVSRTNEIWTAYQVFWERQLNIGDGFICINEEKASQITHTLLVSYYSYVYSLFDGEACHFIQDTETIISDLTFLAKEIRYQIIDVWQLLSNQLKRVRHNSGFHGGKNLKSLQDGYKQIYEEKFNLLLPDCLMLFIEAFFREIEFIYNFDESYLFSKNRAYPKELFSDALNLKASILKRGFGNNWNIIRNPEL